MQYQIYLYSHASDLCFENLYEYESMIAINITIIDKFSQYGIEFSESLCIGKGPCYLAGCTSLVRFDKGGFQRRKVIFPNARMFPCQLNAEEERY